MAWWKDASINCKFNTYFSCPPRIIHESKSVYKCSRLFINIPRWAEEEHGIGSHAWGNLEIDSFNMTPLFKGRKPFPPADRVSSISAFHRRRTSYGLLDNCEGNVHSIIRNSWLGQVLFHVSINYNLRLKQLETWKIDQLLFPKKQPLFIAVRLIKLPSTYLDIVCIPCSIDKLSNIVRIFNTLLRIN